jgi:hypothetical protein
VFELDDLEPGPIVVEPLPFGPRVSRDGLFEGLADQLHGTLAGSDGALQSSASTAGDNVPTDIAAMFQGTVGSAEEAHYEQVQVGPQSSADALTDTGEDVAALRASVLRYLPAPNAPIAASFDPPPDPGVIQTGRGLDDVTPPPSADQPDVPTQGA